MTHYNLSDLLDMTAVQKMAEAHYQATGMPFGIIDAHDGSELVGVGWQAICAQFHRANPASLKCCEESDRIITDQLAEGEARQYKCLNGLWDIGIPIVVAGQHLATLFLGQFFYEGEAPDREFFIRQAAEFGYDLDSYLAALDRVQVFSHEKVDDIVAYNTALAGFIADLATQALQKVKADEDLQFANTLLRTQAETSPDGILVVDEAGKIISFNQRFIEMWHIPPDVVESRSDERALQSVADRLSEPGEFRARIEYLYQHRTERSHEEIRLKDDITFDRYSAPMFGPDGKYYGRVWYMRDITARKRAQDALRKSEERNRALISAMPDLLLQINRDGVILDYHVHNESDLYVRPEAFLGKHVTAVLPPQVSEPAMKSIGRSLDTQKTVTFEYQLAQPDGLRIYENRIVPFTETEVLSVIRDITMRKRAEEELLKFKLGIERSTDAVFMTDVQGTIEYVNPAFEKVYGYPPQEAIGQTPRIMKSGVVPAEVYQQFWATLLNKGVVAGEIVNKTRDGRLITIEGTNNPILDAAGNIIGFLAMHRDITERKQVESLVQLRLRLMEYADAHSLEELLQKMLDEIGELTNSPIGFYHFVEADQKTLSLQAWSTRTQAEFCKAEGQGLHYPIDQAGVWTDCVRERRPIIHNDYQSLPHRKGLPEGHAQVVRELVVPITRGGRIVAILGVGNRLQNYTDQDVALVSYVADLAWEITERKQTEKMLQMFQYTVDRASDAVQWLNRDARFEYVNDQACRALGYTREELMHLRLWDIDPVYPRERWEKNWEEYQQGKRGGSENVETLHRRKDGSVFPVEVTSNHLWFDDKELHVAVVRDITERKRAEEAQKTSLLQQMAMLNNIPDMAWLKDQDSRLIAANEPYAIACGVPPDQLAGKNDFDIWPEDLAAQYRTDDQEVMSTNRRKQIEERMIEQNGRERWLETIKTPIVDSQGHVIGTAGIARDITERKRVEEALRESRNLLQTVLDTIPARVFWKDSDLRYLGCNRPFALDAGVHAPEEMIGKDDYQMGWREQADLYRSDDRQVLESGKPKLNYEEPQTTPDGRRRWLRTNKVPLQAADGTIWGVLGTYEDITERKQTEEALREGEEKYRRLVEVSPMAMWINKDGVITYMNPAALRILRATDLKQVVGRAALDFIHPEYHAIVKERISKMVDREQIVPLLEEKYLRLDGSVVDVEVIAAPFTTAEGRAMQVLFQDITERKRAAEALQQAALIVENSSVMLFRWRAAEGWPVVLVSQNVIQLGYIPEELLDGSVTFSSIVHPDDLERVSREVISYTASGVDRFQQEYRIIAKDGQVRWVDDRTVVERDDTGQATHYQGIVVDITERKQAEEALRASEAKLQLTLEAARLGDWSWNIVTGEVVWSAQCKALYGLSPDTEMTYERFLERVHPEDREDIDAALRRAVETRGDYDVEKRAVWPDGSIHWNATRGRVFCDAGGQPVRLTGVTLDVTERRQADEALRESQWMLRSVLDQFPGVVFWKDRESVYLGCNRAFSTAAGLAAPEEIVGKTDFDLPWAETEAAGYRTDDSAVMTRGQSRLGIIESQHQSDGRLAWFDTSKVPLLDKQGNVIGVLGASRDITEQVRIQNALRETEFFLNKSQQVARIGSYKFDVAAGTWISSPSLDDILGIDSGFLRTVDGWLSLVAPEDHDMMHDHLLQHVLSEHQRFEKEYRIIRPNDGRVCWVFGLGELELDAAGQPIRMIGTIQDINERKQLDARLRASEARYRALVESQVDLISRYRFDTTLTFVNDAYCQFYGKTREELLGQSWLFMVAPEYRESTLKETERFRLDPRPLSGEYLNLRGDGTACWIQWVIQGVLDDNGQVVELQATGRDITKLKQAEEVIRELSRKNEEALRVAHMGHWEFNVASGLFTFNDQYYALHGITAAEAGGYQMTAEQFARKFVHPDDAWLVGNAIQQALGSTEPNYQTLLEGRILRGNGEPRYVTIWFRLERDQHGRPVKLYGVNQDITDRKQAELERERLIVELERKNAELERFTYTVSHDLKSPLITIKGFLGFLEKAALTGDIEQLRSDIARIGEAAKKMERLLSELLELSRIGRIINPPEVVPFAVIAREAVELVRGQLTERQVTVTIAEPLPPVYGDRARLVEVMQNLLDNAVKFMAAQPHPYIEIGARRPESGTPPVLYVRDNGLGIEPQYHQRVFGLFDKLDARSEGTGVGLALVKRIIEVHGGRIWVESEGQGCGATFCFTLPGAEPPARQAEDRLHAS